MTTIGSPSGCVLFNPNDSTYCNPNYLMAEFPDNSQRRITAQDIRDLAASFMYHAQQGVVNGLPTNPHNVTAAQTGAVGSIQGVPADGTGNLTLTGSRGISITPGTNTINISNAAGDAASGGDKAIQYSCCGTTAGDGNLTWDYAGHTLGVCGGMTQGGYLTAAGCYAHAEGCSTSANAVYSHTEGALTTTCSSGNYSHAEGVSTVTVGPNSHAEGSNSMSWGVASHAEGCCSTTCLTGCYAHTEGLGTNATGCGAHAEGNLTTACGCASHAEGCCNTAYSLYSHAEGYSNATCGLASHAEGLSNTTYGCFSHAEGLATCTFGCGAHTEGCNAAACGTASHAEGQLTTALNTASHAEGCSTTACSSYAHAEGGGTYAVSTISHSEGCCTCALGVGSHAEGQCTYSCGQYSHSQGIQSAACYQGEIAYANGQFSCIGDNQIRTTMFHAGVAAGATCAMGPLCLANGNAYSVKARYLGVTPSATNAAMYEQVYLVTNPAGTATVRSTMTLMCCVFGGSNPPAAILGIPGASVTNNCLYFCVAGAAATCTYRYTVVVEAIELTTT
jgi:hypothetical protein